MSVHLALSAVVAGFVLGLSLLVAIGAQNSFVLRQGLRLEHVGSVVLVCLLSDAALVIAGVAGVGSVLTKAPGIVNAFRVVGGGFLLAYAGLALTRARRATRMEVNPGRAVGTGRTRVVGTCLALTWLNPHVYLDTLLLIGTLANARGADRWWFAFGALTASGIWFVSLGYGARLLRPVFARPAAWRVLDVGVAVVMALIAASLLRAA